MPKKSASGEPKQESGEAEEVKDEVKGIKMSEVEQHASIDDLWLVIDGRGDGCDNTPPLELGKVRGTKADVLRTPITDVEGPATNVAPFFFPPGLSEVSQALRGETLRGRREVKRAAPTSPTELSSIKDVRRAPDTSGTRRVRPVRCDQEKIFRLSDLSVAHHSTRNYNC